MPNILMVFNTALLYVKGVPKTPPFSKFDMQFSREPLVQRGCPPSANSLVYFFRISLFVEASDQPEKEEDRRFSLAAVEIQV